MRFPIVPTVIVAAAIATMVALGVWQLGRMNEKGALIARYETALARMSGRVSDKRMPRMPRNGLSSWGNGQ